MDPDTSKKVKDLLGLMDGIASDIDIKAELDKIQKARDEEYKKKLVEQMRRARPVRDPSRAGTDPTRGADHLADQFPARLAPHRPTWHNLPIIDDCHVRSFRRVAPDCSIGCSNCTRSHVRKPST